MSADLGADWQIKEGRTVYGNYYCQLTIGNTIIHREHWDKAQAKDEATRAARDRVILD